MRKRLTPAVLLTGLAFLAGVGTVPALAQISPFSRGPNAQRLSEADRQMLWETTGALNADASAKAGSSRSWTNPASGNAGSVSIARVFESNGMPCHQLHYAITMANLPVPQLYDLSWCRVAGGAWKILD